MSADKTNKILIEIINSTDKADYSIVPTEIQQDETIIKNTSDDLWPDYDQFTEYRNQLHELEKDSAKEFGRTMLTLSGGALGVSISFIRFIAPTPEYTWLCLMSWSFFAASLSATLVSYKSSQEAMIAQRKKLDKSYEENTPIPYENKWNETTKFLNNSSIATFVLGITSIIAFAWLNF